MVKYHIKNSDMNKSLRLIGRLLRKCSPYFQEEKFYKQNKIYDKYLKGRWLSRKTTVETIYINRKDESKLRVLVCRGKGASFADKVTGLLWIHGGGYAVGLPEQDFMFADMFCGDGSCIAVLPDYTRSTESPYPAALNDCYLTLQWMWKHADNLGIDKNQLFVGGESAGGGLTVAVCLYARDKGEIPISFQIPLYPMLDDREITKSSQNNDAPVWNTKSNRAGWNLYLKSVEDKGKVPYYAVPARATDYSGLPPACTFVGTIDPFHDETITYFEELKKAGVPVHIKEFAGCFHGFEMIAYPTKPAKEARKFLLDTFRYAQRNYYSQTKGMID